MLTDEIADLDAQLRPLVERANPQLRAIRGVGYQTAAQLLITAGDNPGSAPRRHLPPSAGSRRSRPPAAKPAATGYHAAATAKPTGHCT